MAYFKKTIVVDEEEIMRLYMAGWTDKRIAEAVGVKYSYVHDWRTKRGYDSNYSIFDYQVKLKRSELKKIPEKYLNPNLAKRMGCT